jgi:hypothetical protein
MFDVYLRLFRFNPSLARRSLGEGGNPSTHYLFALNSLPFHWVFGVGRWALSVSLGSPASTL